MLQSQQPSPHHCKLTACIAEHFIEHAKYDMSCGVSLQLLDITTENRRKKTWVKMWTDCCRGSTGLHLKSSNKLFLVSVTPGLLCCFILQLHRGATPPCLRCN